MIDLHSGLTLNVAIDVTLTAELHFFWRQNTSDGLRNISGTAVREACTSRKTFVGDELDFAVNWQSQRNWSAYALDQATLWAASSAVTSRR